MLISPKPTLHGTASDALSAAYFDARVGVLAILPALRSAAPNACGYFPLDAMAFKTAQA
jgi:hypothetical protein